MEGKWSEVKNRKEQKQNIKKLFMQFDPLRTGTGGGVKSRVDLITADANRSLSKSSPSLDLPLLFLYLSNETDILVLATAIAPMQSIALARTSMSVSLER